MGNMRKANSRSFDASTMDPPSQSTHHSREHKDVLGKHLLKGVRASFIKYFGG